jgi:4Fe-4S dicluster domain
MNVNRIVEVQNGDTLGTLHSFLAGWWDRYEVEAVLAPCESPESSTIAPRLITEKSGLSTINPFAPIMLSNAARTAYQYLTDHPSDRLIVLLRPCELHIMEELLRRDGKTAFETRPILVGVDCLGTIHPEKYFQIVAQSSSQQLTREALHNAATGGLRPQPYRTACQLCDSPAPLHADLIIATLGVETDQCLLFIAKDEQTADRLGLVAMTHLPASEYQVSHRETVTGAVTDLRTAVRKSRSADLNQTGRFEDLGRLLAWFASCDLCVKCLEACPLYEGELDSFFGINQDRDDRNPALPGLAAVGRWLSACSGCGMCEQNCARSIPLTPFLSSLSRSLRAELAAVQESAALRYPYE